MEEPRSNVLRLVTQVGDGYHVEADQILEAAKGQLSQVLVIGWDKDRTAYIASSDGVPENLLLMEVAKATFMQSYFDN